jgi:hypothetical protein
MKLSMSEACFGPNVSIDDESLFQDEYDNRSDDEIRELRMRLINELSAIVNNLDMMDLKTIGEIVVSRSNSFEYIEEESSTTDCDQCGNYNTRETYVKRDNQS